MVASVLNNQNRGKYGYPTNTTSGLTSVLKGEKTNMKYKYNVWIGGVCNTFPTYRQAVKEYRYWISKGYDDVIFIKRKANEQ